MHRPLTLRASYTHGNKELKPVETRPFVTPLPDEALQNSCFDGTSALRRTRLL